MPIIKRRFLWEADDDDNSGNNAPSDPTDTSSSDSSDNTDTSTDDNNDTTDDNEDTSSDNNNDESDTDSTDDNSDDEDYSIDADPDEDDDSSNDNESDDSNDSSDDNNSSDSSNVDKELDNQMFESLSEDEKNRKIATLKSQFIELYGRCDILIDKFNQIDESEERDFNTVIKRISTLLYDMKEYVSYYVINVYDKANYIENDVVFNRYLAVLNGIKLAVEEIQKDNAKEKPTV